MNSEYTFEVSKTVKTTWTFTLRENSFEEALTEAWRHLKTGEQPRGADNEIIAETVEPLPRLERSRGT